MPSASAWGGKPAAAASESTGAPAPCATGAFTCSALSAPCVTGKSNRSMSSGGTGALAAFQSGLEGQADLVIASDGSLLATSSQFFGPSSILRFDPSTGTLLETIATGFDFATALAEDLGVIYTIEGGLGPTQGVLVFTPIPEPGTALLVATGLGFLALRRRRATC